MTGRISRQLTDRITLSDRDVPGERRAQTWMIGATEQAHYAAGCWIWPAYHHEMSCLQLGPFERQHLPLVEPWFTDADTRRWLGGPAWPRQTLDLADRPLGEFRGAAETGRYWWLAWDQGTAVGYIDCGTYDRWTTWEGGPGGRGVIDAIPVPAASISYVVDPALRRRGYCAAMVGAVMNRPELGGIQLFAAGMEPANAGSVGCLRKAGFHPLDPEPDWEGVVYYMRFNDPAARAHRPR